MEHDHGSLVLKAVPGGKVEDNVRDFLSRIYKNVSQDKLAMLVKKAPVVLSKNISSGAAEKIIKKMEVLGASVDFVPKSEAENASVPELVSGRPPERAASARVQEERDAIIETVQPEGKEGSKTSWAMRFKGSVMESFAEVNKELWLVFSLLALAGIMNYLVTAQRMVLGFYTLPTLFSAYFYGRRHATLTAFASVFLVGLLIHFNPNLMSETDTSAFVDTRWYDLTAWAGILVITAYTMGTLHEHHQMKIDELRRTYHGLLHILRQFVSKDKYTENHSYRVSIYAAIIGSYLGLTSDRIEDIRAASLLHDIGKLDVSRQLLHKAARLTQEEFEGMKKHVEKGVDILEPIGGPLRRILPIILAHHDKFDGSGYHSVSGEEIPLEARVIAVADVYDSLTSDRPYRKAMSTFDAKEIIVKDTGTAFDPKVVNAFLSAFRKGEMEVPEVVL